MPVFIFRDKIGNVAFLFDRIKRDIAPPIYANVFHAELYYPGIVRSSDLLLYAQEHPPN